MLTKRVIPKILIKKLAIQKENIIVSLTTKKFNDNKIIGSPLSQATIFNDSKADEIILIDLDHNIIDQEIQHFSVILFDLMSYTSIIFE